MVTDAQIRATTKYEHNNYDKITVRLPKGQREAYKIQAAAAGMSLNAYIIKLLDDDRERLAPAMELMQDNDN